MSEKRRNTRKVIKAKRTVICTDALPWLERHPGLSGAIVTSIPDMSEVGLKYDEYIAFLRKSARLCLESTVPKGYTVFLQTDRKHNGWMDKSYYLQDEAQKLGIRLLWHKIVLRTEPGKTDLYRPTYSHMLCFSKEGAVGTPFPDVIDRGAISYENAFGIDAVKAVVGYLKKQGVTKIVDVFVGSGTTLAVAALFGLDSIGLDIDEEQCRKARAMTLTS